MKTGIVVVGDWERGREKEGRRRGPRCHTTLSLLTRTGINLVGTGENGSVDALRDGQLSGTSCTPTGWVVAVRVPRR